MQNNTTLKVIGALTLVLSAGSAFGANRFNFRPTPSPLGQFASNTARGLIIGGGTAAVAVEAADRRIFTKHQSAVKEAAKEVVEHGAQVAVADAKKQLNIAREIIVPAGLVLVGGMAANHAMNAVNRDEYNKALGFGGVAVASFGAAKNDTCVTM